MDQSSGTSEREREAAPRTDRIVFGVTVVLTVAFVGWGTLATDSLAGMSSFWLSGVLGSGDWAFALGATGFVVFALWLALSRYGRITLGAEGEKPEFRTGFWVAMMLSAGMGIRLLSYALAEPLNHFQYPPPGASTSEASGAMAPAMAITLFHWTLYPWAIFAVVGLAIAYSCYRLGRRQTLSAVFTPLIGEKHAGGAAGKAIDILAVLAIVLGSAGSLGLGALQIGTGMKEAGWTSDVSTGIVLLIVPVLTMAFVAYTFSGVQKGVQRLSNINMVLTTLLAVFGLIAGPTLFILNMVPTSISSFVGGLPRMTTRGLALGDGRSAHWALENTLFYWAWWIALAPFMGMFLARISRGRTIRQFVGGVVLLPSLVSLAVFAVFGGPLMKLEADGAEMADEATPEGRLFAVLREYPVSGGAVLVVMILTALLFVSGTDAVSTVLGTLSQKGTSFPSRGVVVTWGVLIGLVATILLLVGGGGDSALSGVRNFGTFLAAPLLVVMVGMCVALMRDLRVDRSLPAVERGEEPGETAGSGGRGQGSDNVAQGLVPSRAPTGRRPVRTRTGPWRVRGRGRAVLGAAVIASGAVCAGGLWWTVRVLEQSRQNAADTAGVLSFWLGLVGAVFGGWGLWAAVRGLRVQRTAAVVAGELAKKVRWVEGVQYRQLLGSGPSVPSRPIDLPFTSSADGRDEGPRSGRLEDVTTFYRNLRPDRMIITGTPAPDTGAAGAGGQGGGDAGTGKTVLALALLLGLAAQRGTGEPVPVRLTAASWPGGTIRQWIHTHLTGTYHLASRDADLLIEANLVLPVIDGLDEVDADSTPGYTSRAAALLRAVERFEHGGTSCPAILTCRHAHYQALADADARPHSVVHLALDRIDATGAHGYLAQRVATSGPSAERWQPVLTALEAAAADLPDGRSHTAAALAAALDTPWRLNLAITVFQERAPDGNYRRAPADLLTLADEGQLYPYLLDHYIGAAVSAAHHGAYLDVPRPLNRKDRPPRLAVDPTWRRLALLACYLNANAGTASRPPRRVASRTLSSTDIVLHELWPFAGARRVRWIESALSVLFVLIAFAPLGLFDGGSLMLSAGLLPFAVQAVWGRAWPQPRHIDLRRLRTGVLTIVLAGGLVAAIGTGLAVEGWAVLGFLLMLGIIFTVLLLEGGTTSRRHDPATDPREPIRRDLTARLVGGVGTGLVIGGGAGLLSGPETGLSVGLVVTVIFWIVLGLTDGAARGEGDRGTGGHASVRYLALLLGAGDQLPWRLGHFLDSCYQLGILRVAGTAWQFRHRELQDHLAMRPAPPNSR